MISFVENAGYYEFVNTDDAIVFHRDLRPKLITVFERALNTWSNPPAELLKVLSDMKEVK